LVTREGEGGWAVQWWIALLGQQKRKKTFLSKANNEFKLLKEWGCFLVP